MDPDPDWDFLADPVLDKRTRIRNAGILCELLNNFFIQQVGL